MIGSILGGLIGQGGANTAAGLAQGAGREALNNTIAQERSNRSDLSPWMSTGQSAIGQIGALLGYGSLVNPGGEGATYGYQTDPEAFNRANGALQNFLKLYPGYSPSFQADPGYAFRLGEGDKALARTGAAKGTTYSGATMKALTDYNQNFASNEYGNWWNRSNTQWGNALDRLFQTAGMGQNATSSLVGANSGLTTAGNNALLQGNVAAGNDYMAGANALASGIGQGFNNALVGSYLFGNGLFGGGKSGYGAQYGNVGRAGSFGVNF